MQPVQPPLQPFEQPLKHAVPQPEHLTEQFVLQPDSDPPISSIALATMGLLAMIAAPIIGRVRFAAFLKNSRLDWSSSFFLFFCILFIELKDAYELPNSALIFCFKPGNKKRRGSLFLRAYPCSQALALPLCKDKQRKPAHAERYYIVRRRRLPPRYNDSNE